MYELLEETGHSYSGIKDLFNNYPEKTKELLYQIDDKYNEIKEKQTQLEKELELIKNERKLLVSDFINVHKAMLLNNKPISFIRDGYFIEIIIKDDNTIDYEKKEITCGTFI